MLEGIVEKILQKVLGEYLDGFNSSNLNIGIWSGEVVIQNVRLKKPALLKFGLPI
jgi:vacuolar protein sorting-associated protein 13A/C